MVEKLPDPTTHELLTLENYILWGKDSNGQNGLQAGLDVPSKWARNDTSSLEELLEAPGFSESSIIPLNFSNYYKKPRPHFSRAQTRQTAPPDLLSMFEDLWRDIDSIELLLNYYDLAHEKRTKPPRPELLSRFTEADADAIRLKALTLPQAQYLAKKHLLVELRQSQYQLRDSYQPQSPYPISQSLPPQSYPSFGHEIGVAPITTNFNSTLLSKLFPATGWPKPSDFTPLELHQISNFIWAPITNPTFDFRNPQHLKALLKNFQLLRETALYRDTGSDQSLLTFLNLFEWYRSHTPLKTDEQLILDGRIQSLSNLQIQSNLSHQYSENYISALGTKILEKIAATATYHREIIENLFFPENFKRCTKCGQTLLINSQNFMRSKRTHDGFSPSCKRCAQLKRQLDKEK